MSTFNYSNWERKYVLPCDSTSPYRIEDFDWDRTSNILKWKHQHLIDPHFFRKKTPGGSKICLKIKGVHETHTFYSSKFGIRMRMISDRHASIIFIPEIANLNIPRVTFDKDTFE